MGGGDLNLKKSWHPSTLRNIERVWKAEQKHEAEQQKIEQLQKELAEERAREEIQSFAEDQGVVKKKGERLDWMYQGPAALVNREEYLLGRKIDRTFEILQQQETGKEAPKDEGTRPGAIFAESSVNSTVDLANKIREDPLFTIMKKEKEERKTLLNNPVKMKHLQQLLKQSLSKGKKKKKKKSRKHKRSKQEDSDSSEDSSSDSEDSSRHAKKQKTGHHVRVNNSVNGEEKYKHSTTREKESHEVDRKYSREAYYSDKRVSSTSRKNYYSDRKTASHDYNSENQTRHMHSNDYSRSRESSDRRHYSDYRNGEKEKKKLSSEEKERLRQEMLDNAKWREDQRQRNVKRYEKEDQHENQRTGNDASSFIKPMLSKAAASGSVENRVRQKIFSIQRGKADMEKNFARR